MALCLIQTCFNGSLESKHGCIKGGDVWANLDQEVPHPQAGPPRDAPLVDRLEVLQSREGWSRAELLHGSLSWRSQITITDVIHLCHAALSYQTRKELADVHHSPLAPRSTKPKPSLSFFCRSTVSSFMM